MKIPAKRHIETTMALAAIIAGGVWLFRHLHYFGLFTFMSQEEYLFPFDEMGNLPANPVEQAGNWLTQLYINPILAVLIPTVSLVLLGTLTWWWLRRVSRKSITAIPLAIVPVMVLLPWMLMENCPLHAILTVLIVMLVACLNTWAGVVALIIAAACFFYENPASISYAFESSEALADQIYSSPIISAAWTHWLCSMLMVTALALLLRVKRVSRYDLAVCPVALVAAILWASTGLPSREDAAPELRKMQIATLQRLENWQQIETMLTQSPPQDVIELTYLNLALAEQGKLGDTMFQHEQHGYEGLFCQNNGTYRLNVLFSDIFYLTGYLGRAEGNAMDAKRIGMPRQLRRLVEIHTLRGEAKLADKYLNVLSRLRNHSQWADDMRNGRITLPVPIEDGNLALTSMVDIMDVWASQLTASRPNRTAAEYLGAIYLLDKDLHKFASFYLAWQQNEALGTMPRHFDEAAAIIASHDSDFASAAHIAPEVQRQFDAISQGSVPAGTYWEYFLSEE